MSKLYYRLDAPGNPLAADFKFPPPKIGYYILAGSVVKPELHEYFRDTLNLSIDLAVLFCRTSWPSMPGRQDQGVIHSDVTWNNNQWEQLYYAVNYEVTPYVSTLSWWETTDTPVYPPVPNPVTHDDLLRGIHYGSRSNMSPLHSGYRKIDSVDISDQATLVNTNLPHSVDYAGRAEQRWGLSIRFDRKVSDWSEAVELFEKIILT